MRAPPLTRQLAGIVLVVAIPGISCFGWYTLEAAGSTSPIASAIIVAAYPATLILLTLLALELAPAQRNPRRLWGYALSLALSIAVILFARI